MERGRGRGMKRGRGRGWSEWRKGVELEGEGGWSENSEGEGMEGEWGRSDGSGEIIAVKTRNIAHYYVNQLAQQSPDRTTTHIIFRQPS